MTTMEEHRERNDRALAYIAENYCENMDNQGVIEILIQEFAARRNDWDIIRIIRGKEVVE